MGHCLGIVNKIKKIKMLKQKTYTVISVHTEFHFNNNGLELAAGSKYLGVYCQLNELESSELLLN